VSWSSGRGILEGPTNKVLVGAGLDYRIPIRRVA